MESHPNFVKVSFIAKEPGIYKVVWSNEHSWFKAKTLAYRISVLRPVEVQAEEEKASVENVEKKLSSSSLNITQRMTTTKRQSL